MNNKTFITREEYIILHCDEFHITEEIFHDIFTVERCNCGGKLCKGWAIRSHLDKMFHKILIKEELDAILERVIAHI